MNILEYLDNMGERRLKRFLHKPYRPTDWKSFIGLATLMGYYFMVYTFIYKLVPEANIPLVRDAMIVIGPVIGAIAQSLFRSDVRDEVQTNNTGEGFKAMRAQAEATKAAAESIPLSGSGIDNPDIQAATEEVAQAAADKAEEFKG